MLSDAEEAEMNRARTGVHEGEIGSDDEHDHHRHYHQPHEDPAQDEPEASAGGSSEYDSHHRLLHRRHSDEVEQHPHPHHVRHHDAAELARHAGGMGIRNHFNYGPMEEFAEREKADGLVPPRMVPNGNSSRLGASEEALAQPASVATTTMIDGYDAFSPEKGEPHSFARRRHRKMSTSNPVSRRQGKLALFEGFGHHDNDSTTLQPVPTIAPDTKARDTKAPRQPKNALSSAAPTFAPYSDAGQGHDRPYRFAFYSNTLPVTIHARNLAELPAEGQTFEDLFKGKNEGVEDVRAFDGTEVGSYGTDRRSGMETPNGDQGPKMSLVARAAGAAGKGSPAPESEDDPEQFTWWLDVLSPTDEEMRMLSKVCIPMCPAHCRSLASIP